MCFPKSSSYELITSTALRELFRAWHWTGCSRAYDGLKSGIGYECSRKMYQDSNFQVELCIFADSRHMEIVERSGRTVLIILISRNAFFKSILLFSGSCTLSLIPSILLPLSNHVTPFVPLPCLLQYSLEHDVPKCCLHAIIIIIHPLLNQHLYTNHNPRKHSFYCLLHAGVSWQDCNT
jgi:hypothetical protein